MYTHLLVPLDGTPLGFLTVEQAVEFAREAGAKISFFNAQADFGGTGEGSLLQSMAPDEFREVAIGNSLAWLARAESAARARNVPCEIVTRVSGRPHEAILEAAIAQGCDLIYMASHGRKGLRRRITGTITERLLEIATVPVLVARVETAAVLTAEQRAITVIRNEHRSLGAVVRGMLDLAARNLRAGDDARRWLTGALFYIEHFPERLHHPREEQTLFRLLRERAPGSHAVLDELERQHRDGATDLQRLREAADAFLAGASEGRDRFQQVLGAYAEALWRHMDLEENLLMPMAGQALRAEDWESIAQAFESNEDPRFDVASEASFAEVMKRLMAREAAKAGTR